MISAPDAPQGTGELSRVAFADFKKSDLRVARILEVSEIPGADRLWKLHLDVGAEKKEIVAGIKAFYTREQLLGKSIVIVHNLEPSVIRGVESHGMLLAASTVKKADPATGGKDEKRLSLLMPDQDLPPGSSVG